MDEALADLRRKLEELQQQLDAEPPGEKRDALLLELLSTMQDIEGFDQTSSKFHHALRIIKDAMNALAKRKPKKGA